MTFYETIIRPMLKTIICFNSRYGDRSPVTVPDRIFAIVWVLMGLVIISIVTGGIVTSITLVLVVQEGKLYGARVKIRVCDG